MSYDSLMVKPMREELTRLGFRELRTSDEVNQALTGTPGTALVVVNSVCGCAAGGARPAVALALKNPARPQTLLTVFAGQDAEATTQARSYFTGYKPSSPSMALVRNGELLWMLERHQIEGRAPEAIAATLVEAFEKYGDARA